jgi:chromate transporter
VVGVIASLALFFLVHIASGQPGVNMHGWRVDWVALGLAAAATIALLRFKAGVIPVIAGCALCGLVLRLAGWA